MNVKYSDFKALVGLSKSMLVVVPHPDDETIGCGGLLALAASENLEITVVVVTDGSASHTSVEWPPERLAALRRLELGTALHRLGVTKPPTHLNLPDAQTLMLGAEDIEEAQKSLTDLIDEKNPDLILTTWRREPHCDHKFSFALTRDAINAAAHAPLLLEYMIWTPILGSESDWPQPGETQSCRLDIRSVLDAKLAALWEHKSQMGQVVADDPTGFVLTPDDAQKMIGSFERYDWTG